MLLNFGCGGEGMVIFPFFICELFFLTQTQRKAQRYADFLMVAVYISKVWVKLNGDKHHA
jgi:hypothetical protein